MAKRRLTIQRLIFLFVLVGVFIFTYVADFHILGFVLSAVSAAFPWAMRFYIPFFILSSIGLITYYLIYENTNDPKRYLPWVRIFSIAFIVGLIFCSLIIYSKILMNSTFDL